MSMDENSPPGTVIEAPNPETLWTRANALAAQGNLLDAIPLYLELSDLWPQEAMVWLNLGIVLGALHRHDEARQCLERSLDMEPDSPLAEYQLGQMHEHLGGVDTAASHYLAATELDPGYLDAWNSLADISLQCDELDLARQYLETVLQIDPNDPAANFLLGNLALKKDDDVAAARCFSIAYEAANDPACGNNLASTLARLDQLSEAIDLLQKLVRAHPAYKLAWNTLGGLLMQRQRYGEGRTALEQAVSIDEEFHAARHGLARCLVHTRDLLGAQAQLEHLSKVTPNDVSVLKDYAVVTERLGDFEHTAALRERAIALAPDDPRLIADHANLLHSVRRFDEALAFAERALALDHTELRAQIVVASTFILTDRLDEAQDQLRAIVSSGTRDVLVLNMVASLFEKIKEAAQAVAVYEYILELVPDDSTAAVRIFDLKMAMCDWEDYDEICRSQIERIEAGGDEYDVFNLQALPVDYAFIGKIARQAAAKIAATAMPEAGTAPLVYAAPRSERIRLGYAVGYTWFHSFPLVHEEIVRRHDRDRFEVFGYSMRPSDGSKFCAGYRGAFDHFRDLPDTAPHLAAQIINQDGIDVLIDASGLTSINCMPVCSFRPAPVQMHAFGYSITTGADYIDYLVTDRTYIPEEWEAVGTEKLLYLPDTFMPTKRPEKIGDPVSRADVGLPEGVTVFSNFNHPCKFEPRIFAAWMEIMDQVLDSVLWFGAWMHDTQANLRRQAAKYGIDGDRLIFAKIVDHESHLARLKLVDLALDNFQHGGGVTSVDALWVGLPVLTVLGDKPGARLGATLCNAAGIPDMITPDLPSYIERAIALANDPEQRRQLHQRLIEGRESHPLFDNERFNRNLDDAIVAAWQNHLAGRPPQRIELDA
ncbi:MAG: tetratricopeptide repeat protein [Rhodospirillaceae bacterium]|nr:tetratricopeptide repeat protein [Rhodospirillaceae bacterium]